MHMAMMSLGHMTGSHVISANERTAFSHVTSCFKCKQRRQRAIIILVMALCSYLHLNALDTVGNNLFLLPAVSMRIYNGAAAVIG